MGTDGARLGLFELVVCTLCIIMNWQSHTAVVCLWSAQPILQSALAVILWRRKLHKQFPVFFVFLLAQVVNFAVIFPLWLTGNYNLYFTPFWLGEAVNAVLGFKVIHEIFVDVFRPYHTLKDLGTLLFKWAGIVMLLVSVVVACSHRATGSYFVPASIFTLSWSFAEAVKLWHLAWVRAFRRG